MMLKSLDRLQESMWNRVGEKKMSERNRTKEEYTELYAKDYTDGDVDEAREHQMVKEVCETLKEK